MSRSYFLLSTAALLLLEAWPFTPVRAQNPADRYLREGAPTAQSSGKMLHQRAAGTSLWNEDFENGLNGWTVNTSAGNVNWQLTTTGNTGGYTPGPLESTTGFPGGNWIVADSDADGSPGVDENTSIMSPPITGFDTVQYMLLSFEQSFRQLNDDETLVEVSGNGGLNWTVYPVNTEVPGNQMTPGAPASQLITLNISDALAGGSSDIRLRFRWISSEGYTYSWQVDDVELTEASDNDLKILSATHAAWDLTADDFNGLPYTVYPVNEVRELKFRAQLVNNGSQTQHNVRLRATVDGPGANDAVLYSDPIDVAPAQKDSLFIAGWTPPASVGTYYITYALEQDETEDDPADNAMAREFAVSDFIFARDEGITTGGYDNEGDEYELGNWFHVNDWDNTLYAIDVAVTNQSDVGAPIRGLVYDAEREFLTETDEYFIQASDLNDDGEAKFITLVLPDPLPLEDDADYLVAMHHYGGTEEVFCATSGVSTEQTSLILDYSNATWFYVTNTPMVRMNFSPSVGVQTPSRSEGPTVVAMPSVFEDRTTLQMDLPGSEPVRIKVLDATGRVVRNQDMGRMAPGRQQIELDLSHLAAGTYTCTVQAGDKLTTVRLLKR